MMNYLLYDWPFQAEGARSPEDAARWWEICYQPSDLDELIDSLRGWSIISGAPGSGKSTLMRAFLRRHAGARLVIEYSPSSWGGMKVPSQANHLFRIQHLVSQALGRRLAEQPYRLEQLSPTQLEFLRWLIHKYNDTRAFTRWLDALPPSSRSLFTDIVYSDLYPSQVEIVDVEGQIEELLILLKTLDLSTLTICLDLDSEDQGCYQAEMIGLFDRLELMHHPDFQVIAFLPDSFLREGDWFEKTRGRVQQRRIPQVERDSLNIAQRALSAASGGRMSNLADLFMPECAAQARDLVVDEYGGHTPGGWLRLVELGLSLAGQGGAPLDAEAFPRLQQAYYQRFAPLRFDESSGQIWRGHKLLQKMDLAPMELFVKVWHAGGHPLQSEQLSRNPDYAHTLAKRVRQVIEPDPKQPIYLLNQKSVGYWLANCRF